MSLFGQLCKAVMDIQAALTGSFVHNCLDMGWKDAAVLQNAIDGKPIEPTWKATTRLDYILIPLQLLPLFIEYDNLSDTISDHARITVSFDTPSPDQPRCSGQILETNSGLYGPPKGGNVEARRISEC